MGTVKIFHVDAETTGTDSRKHAIHQLSGIIEINGIIKDRFDFKIRPHPTAEIVESALAISKVYRNDIMLYPDGLTVMRNLVILIEKHIDWTNLHDKFFISGFNSSHFDNDFLYEFFKRNACRKFRNYFWNGSLDTRTLALNILRNERAGMPDFTLLTVVKRFNIEVDESQLHNAAYDVWLSYCLLNKINHNQ